MKTQEDQEQLNEELQFAARKGQVEEIKTLIKSGADFNVKDYYDGDTPLHNASEKGQTEAIRTLISLGADINAKNKNGDTPLHHATLKRSTIALETLIKLGADINAKNERGQTPLFYAAKIGYVGTVDTLIKLGADPHSVDNEGNTVLFSACSSLSARDDDVVSLINLLCEKGVVDLHRVNKKGNNALHISATVGERDQGRVKTINTLVDLGVNVDAYNEESKTPLLISTDSGNDSIALSIIDLLMQKGANRHAVDKDGNNALHLAAYDGGSVRVKGLIDLGIDVNATNNEGKTPLHFAISKEMSESVKALLDGNANPLFADKDGKTYLHSLVESPANSEARDITRSLIEKGVDINAVDNEGKTALQIAVEKCYTSAIKLLLENGANTDSFTAGPNENKTLIEVIALNANENIPEQNKIINFNELFKHGAEINTQFLEDPHSNISDDIRDYLRSLCDPKKIDNRNKELHNKYVTSILNGDPLPRCNDFIGGVIFQAIKSIELDQIKDNSKIKKSDYYKLIELNKNIENSDEIIKAIIKYPKEFEKLVETSSKLKATSKGVTQGSQIDQTETLQTQVLFDSNLSGIILENSLSPNFKKALGPSATKLTNYLMETEFSNFIKAISDNNLEKVEALANEKNINRTLDGQISSLGIAVEKGSNEIIEFLLKKGAKISEESLKTLREKYEKNDLITERLNLVEEKQKSRVSSEPSATTQIRAGSSTRGLVRNYSQEINCTIQ